MKFQDLHHDEALLEELGRRVAQLRIEMNLTQSDLARQAGVGKRTLERLEAGETTQTRTLFRILRELDLLSKLDVLLPEPGARPRDIAKVGAGLPQRATRKKSSGENAGEWKWGDER